RGLDQEVMTKIEKVGQDMIEAMKIAIQEVIIEGVEIVDQEVMIEEIEIVNQEVMIEEIEIVDQEVMREEDDQVMIAEVDDRQVGKNKEIQKLFKEFLNQKLNSDNISSYINEEDLLGQNHSRPQEQSKGSSSSNVRFKYLDLTDLSDNLLAALRHQVFWIIEKILSQNQLKLEQTFHSQKNL
ncbi:28307_t:CDS:2, partial [Dentiscutata erythropus]